MRIIIPSVSLSKQDKKNLIDIKKNTSSPITTLLFSIFYGEQHCGSEWFDNNEYKFPSIVDGKFSKIDIEQFVEESLSHLIDLGIVDIDLSIDIIVNQIIQKGYFVVNNVDKVFSIVFSSNWRKVAIYNEKNKGSIIRWRELDHNDSIIYQTFFYENDYWSELYYFSDYFL